MKKLTRAIDFLNLLMERLASWTEREDAKLYKEMYIKEINSQIYTHKYVCISTIVDNDYLFNVTLLNINHDIHADTFNLICKHIDELGKICLDDLGCSDVYGLKLQGIAYAHNNQDILVRIKKPILI